MSGNPKRYLLSQKANAMNMQVKAYSSAQHPPAMKQAATTAAATGIRIMKKKMSNASYHSNQ